jgi:hypothetical protein
VNPIRFNRIGCRSSADHPSRKAPTVTKTGTLKINPIHEVRHIVTVDGGLALVPNPVRRDKALSFVQVGAMVISIDELEAIATDPMLDPRRLKGSLERIDRYTGVLPFREFGFPIILLRIQTALF